MNRDFAKYILSLLLFGSNGIAASMITLSSYEIVLYRALTGSVLLMVIFFAGKRCVTFYKNKKDFIFLCISGAAMGACWVFLYEAYDRIGVSIASLCYYCGPVLVMALSPLLFKEKLTRIRIVSFVAVLIGIFMVNGSESVVSDRLGILCGVMAAVMYSVIVIFNKKNDSIIGVENSMLQLFVSFLAVAVFVLIKDGFIPGVGTDNILPLLFLGIVNTGAACYLYFSSIGRLPAQTVAVCGYLEPLSAVVFSVMLLGEVLLPVQIIGMVLIVGGAAAGEMLGKSKEAS